MRVSQTILAVDQGTTSTKAILVADDGTVVATSAPQQFAIEPHYPRPGWVEYDPEEIWQTVCASGQAAIRNLGVRPNAIRCVGLANQGETVVAFDSETGQPVYPAISWQDRRGEAIAAQWRRDGLEDQVLSATGLRLDPYFSAPKLAWILQNVDEARELLAAGRLRLATSDAWILWRLTGGEAFVTDVATASRTMLFDLKTLSWNPDLAQRFGIPLTTLPEVRTNAGEMGLIRRSIFGAELPITGLCVDQQAALFGQRAFNAGQAKVTYGTGCFLLAHVGSDASARAEGLLTSVGWQIAGEACYVLDGGVYSAGSLCEWLVSLGLAADVAEVGQLASQVAGPSPVALIPAFSGLAAPHWSGTARACWLGMDQGTERKHLVRAGLEAIAFRVKEICDAAAATGISLEQIQVDGGLTRCDPLMQLQADILGLPLTRSEFTEATALGAAYLAGLGSGCWPCPAEIPGASFDAATFFPRDEMHAAYAPRFQRWKRLCRSVVEMGDAGLF